MGKKKKTQVVGYRYGLAMHMAICHAPVDEVSKIEVDDRTAWSGSVTTSGNIYIDNFWLFGGDDGEGGLKGGLDILMGEPTQAKNPRLVRSLGANIPAFRGILSFVYDGFISANSRYLKSWQFTVKRLTAGWNTTVFYPERIAIGEGMNPAHIIYQCLTDTEWGMGYPTSAIDEDSFTAAADTLYSEEFGLSLIWNQQGTIESFIQIVLNHVGCSLTIDPRTGLFRIKLLRADFDIDDLPVFDESNIQDVISFQRSGWGETVNQIDVTYTDPITRKETVTTVQDLANIQAQGAVVSQAMDFIGITSHVIARKVAMRELLSRSSPVARVGLKIKRDAWNLASGDVIAFSWPKLGIDKIALRVGTVNTGTLEDGLITVETAEDIYGLPASSYVEQEPGGWVDPIQPPTPAPARKFVEATYFDLATTLTPADLAAVLEDECYAVMYAQQPSNLAQDFKLKDRTSGSGDFIEVDTSAHTPTCVLADDLAIEEFSTVSIASVIGYVSLIETGNYAIIENEYVRVDAIDLDANTLTIARGVIDTVPVEHAAGAKVFFAETMGAVDGRPWPEGAEIDAKVITTTASGILAEVDAPIDTLEVFARHFKPYPPGKFRINGDYMPASVTDDVVITWEERNRLQQTVYLLAQDETSITPEVGTTYTIKIFDQSDTLVRTLTGLTGTSYTYTVIDELADCGGEQTHLRVELLAERDSVQSWQSHSHRFERVYTP